ncbi:MAG: exo-alpha-sialidase [Lactobacillus sp.]|nr:exo-alpha-sialidase [Lentilactobacillus hilgardii]RRG07559.1 MAG: exo-alpha-sialidase [Lactobacillus sp.]
MERIIEIMFKHRQLASIAKIVFAFGIVLMGSTVSAHAADRPTPVQPTTVYKTTVPASGHLLNNRDYGARSPRVIQLEHQANSADNGKLLLTFEQVPEAGQTPVFPIYESDDNGAHWNWVSNVHQTKEVGWGMANCPQLYELPQQIGDMPKGTIVIAGDATPNDLSGTQLQLTKSTDVGKTWKYESTIASGGANFINDDPIWEPYLMVHNNKLVCYYSDERDSSGLKPKAQAIVHQTTTDGTTWSPLVMDVDPNGLKDTDGNDDTRPGMPVVTPIGNGKWAMTYEQKGGASVGLKISSDPESWNSTSAGTTIAWGGAPYITTLNDGRIAFNNNGSDGKVYIFNNAETLQKGIGAADTTYKPKVGQAYNREIMPLANGMLLVVRGEQAITVETIDVGDKAINSSDSGATTPTTPVTPTTPTSSSSSSVQSSSSSVPAASSSSVSSSSSSTVSSTSSSTTTTAPSTSVIKQVKPFKVAAVKALYRYNNVNFSKANRIKHYAKKSITKAPVFTVVATTKSSNGALRYQLSDGSYITTKAGYVTKLYNQAKIKTLRVINPKGTWEYKSSKLTKKSAVKHLKKSKVVKVKKLVRKGTATRYQLTNGHYVTGNKQFVKVTK